MSRPAPLLLFSLLLLGRGTAASAADAVRISTAERQASGVLLHRVESPYQSGTTELRILLPPQIDPARRCPVVYLLPVEADNQQRWGDSLTEALQHELPQRHGVICVFPTFSHLPWYADHPTDPVIRQESYLLQVVLPFVERTYPAGQSPDERLLVGFSKSGWGAWSLLLRHPDKFGRAAAWDAPLMQARPDRYGMQPIFGTQENFDRYQITRLLAARAELLHGGKARLLLLGQGNFAAEHVQTHALLEELQIPHVYRADPPREHSWHSGWLSEAVAALVAGD